MSDTPNKPNDSDNDNKDTTETKETNIEKAEKVDKAENKNVNSASDILAKRQKENITTIIIVAMFAALVGIIIYLLITRNTTPPPAPPVDIPETVEVLAPPEKGDGRGILVTPENVDDLKKEDDSDTTVNVALAIEWNFLTWDTPSLDAYVENPGANLRTVYIDVHLWDDNAEENLGRKIYSSPYIPVGQKLNNFSLDEPIQKGEYEVVVRYTLVDDDFNPITHTQVSIQMNVLGNEGEEIEDIINNANTDEIITENENVDDE